MEVNDVNTIILTSICYQKYGKENIERDLINLIGYED
jgi:hypothetical protein